MNYNKATMKGRGPKALMLVVVLLIMSFSAIVIESAESNDAATVTITPSSDTIEKGSTRQLTATVSGATSEVTITGWSSSNTSVATVSDTGLVTAVADGTATITATASDATPGHSEITVRTSVTGVNITESTAVVEIGKTITLHATLSPSDATNKTMNWSSGTSTVATVSSSTTSTASATMTITGVAEGTAVITARSAATTSLFDTCTVTVIKAVTSVTIDPTSLTLYHNNKASENSATIGVTVVPADVTYRDWSSSNTNVATVDNNGKVTAVGQGTATITLKIGSFTRTCSVTVSDVALTSIALDKTTVEVDIGSTVDITPLLNNSTGSHYPTNDKITWTASASGKISGLPSGEVSAAKVTLTGVAEGSVTITATTKEGSKTAQCTITVKPVLIEKVEIEGGPYSLEVDETEDLKAKLKFTPANATNKNVTWTSSDSTKVEINANGVITAKAPGTATITVTTVEGSHTATTTVTVVQTYTIEADVTESQGKGNVGNVTELLNKIEATKAKGLNPIVDIDASHSDYVSMTSDIITKLKGIKGAELHIELKLGGMALDNSAMSKLPKGNMIGFSINTTTLADTYAKYAPYYAYDVSIYSGELKVPTNFGSAHVTVAIKYDPKPGEDEEKLVVAYVPDKGTPVLVSEFDYNSEYDCIVFETNHCSSFMVLFHDNDIKPEGDGFIVFIVFMIIVIVLIVLITLYIRSANGFKGMFAVNGNNRRQQPPQPPTGYYPPAVEYNNYYNYRR